MIDVYYMVSTDFGEVSYNLIYFRNVKWRRRSINLESGQSMDSNMDKLVVF